MPRKSVSGGRRFPVSLRVTQEMRDRLGAEAKASGRSIAQLVELKLERASIEEGMLGGPRLRELALFCWATFVTHGRYSAGGKDDWLDETGPYANAGAALLESLLSRRADEALLIEAWLSRLLTRKVRRKMEEDAQRTPSKQENVA